MAVTISLVLALTSISAQALERTLDITFLWNKFTELKTIGDCVVGLNSQGVAVLEWDDVQGKLIEVNHLVLSSPTKSTKLQGDVLVVRHLNEELTFLNVGQFNEITVLGSVAPSDDYFDFILIGNDLYLSLWFDGVDKYHVSNYQSLEFVSNDVSGVAMTRLDYDYNYLYALDRYNGIARFPLSEEFGQSVEFLLVPERPFSFVRASGLFVITLNSEGGFFGVFDDGDGSLLVPFSGIPSPAEVFAYNTKLVFVSPRQIDIMDGSAKSIDRTIPLESQYTAGDTITIGINIYLMLPIIENGITAFNLTTEEEPKELLGYPGAVNSVLAFDNALFTGGDGNPLELYRLDSDSLSEAELLNGFETGLKDLVLSGEHLYALYPDEQKIFIFDGSYIDGIIEKIDSIELSITDAQKLKSFYLPSKSTTLLLAAGIDAIEVISGVGGNLQSETLWEFDKPLADFVIFHSKLYVTDRFGSASAYDIESDYSLTKCGDRDLTGTGWAMTTFNDKIFVFTGNTLTLFENCLEVDTVLHLPFSVLDAEILDDTLFTIGAKGLAKYHITSGLPVYVESGGLSGSKISVGSGFIAATDGGSVNLYFRNSAPLNPGDNENNASRIVLYNNYPDPFNASTVIQFELPAAQQVNLSLYNVLGQQVRTLVDEIMPTGNHEVRWDGKNNIGKDVASGIYFYKLQSDEEVLTRKMMLIR